MFSEHHHAIGQARLLGRRDRRPEMLTSQGCECKLCTRVTPHYKADKPMAQPAISIIEDRFHPTEEFYAPFARSLPNACHTSAAQPKFIGDHFGAGLSKR